jgi:hypothetical protein
MAGGRRVIRREALATLVALMVLAAMAAPPAPAQLTPTDNPLPGSIFQGADGDQDDAPPLIDWQGVAGRVQHSPDDNDADTAFAGGSEELLPGGWGLTTASGGVTPAKDNIRDAWSAVDQPAQDTFLYLGFTRDGSVGTTYLTFELNRDHRLWDNGRAIIPCRRTGDVQISYEPSGNEVVVAIRRWTTTIADAATGCARAGQLTTFDEVEPNVDAQAALNALEITSHLPGAYRDTVPFRRFGEASLNLARLLEEAFDDECLAYTSIWMHSRASTSVTSALKDYVAPQPVSLRTCAASGVKFFDSNANGQRDEGEPGIPRFVIWADYNDDGVHDDDEPFGITDDQGEYVIDDIRPPPPGTYRLRERLLESESAPEADWICSYPSTTAPGGRFPCAHGPIDAATTPNAEGRDFGNWFPAQLTVEKEIEPAGDPGRFDLLVNGEVVVPAAGDGASMTLSLPPGTYEVSERAVAGTDPTHYLTTVNCRSSVTRFGRFVGAPAFTGLHLLAGQQGSCKFFNVRTVFPGIAIRKRGPAIAVAGATLEYELLVTNPGHIPLPEAAVTVTDAQCDDPPELTSKEGDTSPETLDPGDRWIYGCSNATTAGADCEPTTVANTAVVTGTAVGMTVTDDDSIATMLSCPDVPEPPTPVPPDPPGPEPPRDPDVPGPVAPPGPRPPNAGDAAVARLAFARATRRCLRTRVPRVHLSGTRIARVRIFVNGRLVRGLNLRTLQSRRRPRVTLAPGRYRVTARVRFERGSGTPPLALTRTVRICGRRAAPPRFTG